MTPREPGIEGKIMQKTLTADQFVELLANHLWQAAPDWKADFGLPTDGGSDAELFC